MPDGWCEDLAVTTSDGTSWVVRKLTPREYERLQGFPDDFTDIGEWVDASGKRRKSSDSLRYKCLGNSMSVPVMSWIAERIQQVQDDADDEEDPSRYAHDVGFDEGYQVGYEDGWSDAMASTKEEA